MSYLFEGIEPTNGTFEKKFQRPEALPNNTVVKAVITGAEAISTANYDFLKFKWDFKNPVTQKTTAVEQVLFIYDKQSNDDLRMFMAILEAYGYTEDDKRKILNPVTNSCLEKLLIPKGIMIKLGQKTVKKGWSKDQGKYDLPSDEWYKENTVKGVGVSEQGTQQAAPAQAAPVDDSDLMPF